jgi:hypothetical protein
MTISWDCKSKQANLQDIKLNKKRHCLPFYKHSLREGLAGASIEYWWLIDYWWTTNERMWRIHGPTVHLLTKVERPIDKWMDDWMNTDGTRGKMYDDHWTTDWWTRDDKRMTDGLRINCWTTTTEWLTDSWWMTDGQLMKTDVRLMDDRKKPN